MKFPEILTESMLEIVYILILKSSLTTDFDNYLAWSIKVSNESYSHEGWLRRLTTLKEEGNKSIQISRSSLCDKWVDSKCHGDW